LTAGPDGDDPFAGMDDKQVLELARSHLRREVSLPPRSLGRIAAGQQYDRCQAELARRMTGHVLRRLDELGLRAGDPEGGAAP